MPWKLICGLIIAGLLLTACAQAVPETPAGPAPTPTEFTFPEDFEQSVFDLCLRKHYAVPGARAYDPAQSYHPIMWVDVSEQFSNQGHQLNNMTEYLYLGEGDEWVQPGSAFEYELVACARIVEEKEGYSCSYTGGLSYTFMRAEYEIEIISLADGVRLDAFPVFVDAKGWDCEDYIQTNLKGNFYVSTQLSPTDIDHTRMLKTALGKFVFQQGETSP